MLRVADCIGRRATRAEEVEEVEEVEETKAFVLMSHVPEVVHLTGRLNCERGPTAQ